MLLNLAKSVLRTTVSPVLDFAGIYDRRLRGDGWTILMYHRVVNDLADAPFGLGMCVRRAHFASQIAYLRRNFNVLSLREGIERIARGDPLPPRAVSVTFDDGYLDNMELALPILEAHQVPFTVYVASGGLAEGEGLWYDRVRASLASTSEAAVDTARIGLPGPGRRLSLSRWQREATIRQVLDGLWSLPIREALEIVSRIERVYGTTRDPVFLAPRMSPAQVRAMHGRGVEIGAHTVNHPNLSLMSQAEAEAEMLESRRVLEELCQAPVDGFAYPGGKMSASTVAAARAAGFRHAVTTIKGINNGRSDVLQLRRVGMPDNAVSDFKRALGSAMRTGLALPRQAC
ncbi:polysaccharide deacetylase family protein [Caldimonas tepidiphila]|uniref:polysaccharide deacetylase family protein n=1 Tax=Caldimonas tepidiphila TaxID=2315841 RepID=UPI0013006BA4|nr:polysaccharide deacetylase family protein [Caldimonas tepidiphila]